MAVRERVILLALRCEVRESIIKRNQRISFKLESPNAHPLKPSGAQQQQRPYAKPKPLPSLSHKPSALTLDEHQLTTSTVINGCESLEVIQNTSALMLSAIETHPPQLDRTTPPAQQSGGDVMQTILYLPKNTETRFVSGLDSG
jgi:hypothetical protein